MMNYDMRFFKVVAPCFIAIIMGVQATGSHNSSSGKAKSLSNFIPADYEILDSVRGDLNLDKIPDMILVLKKKGEDTAYTDPPARRMLILTGRPSSQFSLAAKSDSVVLLHDQGGVSFSEPFVGVEISTGSFTIKHYGGMGMGQWSSDVTFKYNTAKGNWFLNKTEKHFIVISSQPPSDDSTQVTAEEPQLSVSSDKEVIKTTKDFGVISFEKFFILKDDE